MRQKIEKLVDEGYTVKIDKKALKAKQSPSDIKKDNKTPKSPNELLSAEQQRAEEERLNQVPPPKEPRPRSPSSHKKSHMGAAMNSSEMNLDVSLTVDDIRKH